MEVLELERLGVGDALEQMDDAVAQVQESLLGLYWWFEEFSQVQTGWVHVFSFFESFFLHTEKVLPRSLLQNEKHILYTVYYHHHVFYINKYAYPVQSIIAYALSVLQAKPSACSWLVNPR